MPKRQTMPAWLKKGLLATTLYISACVAFYGIESYPFSWEKGFVVIGTAILVCLISSALAYWYDHYMLFTRVNPAQKVYFERLLLAYYQLDEAEKSLRAAYAQWQQPNLERAIVHIEKTREVWSRRMTRLQEEMKVRKCNG